MAFNFNQVVLPALQNGHHNVRLTSYEDASDAKGDRILLTFQFEDREFKQFVFPSNLNYWLTGLRAQCGRADQAMSIGAILEVAKETNLEVWVSRNDFGINLSLYPPKATETSVSVEDLPL